MARSGPARAVAVCTCLVPVALLSTAPIGPSGAASATPTPAHVRLGRAPLLPRDAAAMSSLPSAATLQVDVILQPADPSALAAYATDVSTPGSTSYRQVLSEQQFVHRFGPPPDAIASVTRALTDSGLHPGPVSGNHLSIPVQATAGQLEVAFSTGFKRYRLHGGRLAYANTSAPQVARSIAPFLQGVVGLDDLTVATPAGQPAGVAPGGSGPVPHVVTGGPQPCATAVHDGATDSSYTTDQLASAYGFSHLYSQGDLGSGQTVALYELQGYGTSDIATYQSCYATSTAVTAVDVDGGPTARSGVGEADIDIEEVLGLAPQAHIVVYQGPNSPTGAFDTYDSIMAQDTARVVSTSWGLCEPSEGSAEAQAENTLFEEAAIQGQSVLAASGDEGSEDCLGKGYADDSLAVDDPASQPFVTGVGGTSWSAAGTPPAESAWNDGPTCCWGSGGGGISTLWAMPAYQTGAEAIGTVNARSSGTPCAAAAGSYCREVPDVSALAGPYPYLNYVSGSWGSWGGTSLAAPLWASMIALTNASPSCGGQVVGFANPALYAAATTDPAAFNDVTTGDNDLTGRNDGAFPAGPGYDMATGLGTPDGAALPQTLCAGITPSPVAVESPGSQTTDVGTPRLPPGRGQRRHQAPDAHLRLVRAATRAVRGVGHGAHHRHAHHGGHLLRRGHGRGRRGGHGRSLLLVVDRPGHHQRQPCHRPRRSTVLVHRHRHRGPHLHQAGRQAAQGHQVPPGGRRHGHTGRDPRGQGHRGVVSAGHPSHVREEEDGHGGHPVVRPGPGLVETDPHRHRR